MIVTKKFLTNNALKLITTHTKWGKNSLYLDVMQITNASPFMTEDVLEQITAFAKTKQDGKNILDLNKAEHHAFTSNQVSIYQRLL